jgi:uncharacterized damage-inducible protein DinB
MTVVHGQWRGNAQTMFSTAELFFADLEYSFWANDCLLRSVGLLSLQEIDEQLPISHGTIRRTLVHIYMSEKIWLDFLRTPVTVGRWCLPREAPFELTIPVLSDVWPILRTDYHSWISGLSSLENALTETLRIELPERRTPPLPRWKILRHAMDHSNFHRGQVVGAIRALNHIPPAINRMDFLLRI